jgi:uncharacterized protein
MELNRRNFLRLTGIGVAGGVIATTTSASAANPILAKKLVPEKIIYRKLGNTGIKLPIVSIGVMRVDTPGIITSAYDAGIRHFDTANNYQGGKSETLLGEALKPYKRDSYIISTKINTGDKENPEAILLKKFNDSLERLQMDYVDILYMHGPSKPEQILNEQIVKVFQDLKKQGKAKFIGISVHSNIPLMIKTAIDTKIWDVILTSYNFKMADYAEVKSAIADAAKAGIGIIAMKTLNGSGYLDKEKTNKINTVAALKWVLNDENVCTAIPGVTSFDQLDQNTKLLADVSMTDQEKLELKAQSATAGLFCVGCEQCVAQCPNKVPVPDLMRAYMYAYGCNDTKMAREVVDGLAPHEHACTLCPECRVECRLGFDVQLKAKDILRIKDVPTDFLV